MLTLHDAQRKIAEDTHRYRIVRCGRRFGKTEFAIEDIIVNAVWNDGKVLYVAPTQKQARDIIWDKLKNRVEEIATKVDETKLEVRIPNKHGGESLIVLGSWEKVENLRGNEFCHIVLDEVREMKKSPGFMYYWKNTLKPTLLTTGGTADFLSTPNGFDHFYELTQEALNDDDWIEFHFTSYDNPFNPKEELDKLQETEPDDVFAQEYMAEFRKRTGLVYPEFHRQRHIFEREAPEAAEVIAGVDFGYTNPAAVLTIVRDKDDSYWVTEEFYESGRTSEQIAEYVAANNYNKVYPDPASPEAIKHMRDRRVNVIDVIKGGDSITNGINKIRALLKQGRLKIHSSCKNLIYEIEQYHFPNRRLDSNAPEVPVKENDHALDALRYALMMNQPTKNNAPMQRYRMIMNRRGRANNSIID